MAEAACRTGKPPLAGKRLYAPPRSRRTFRRRRGDWWRRLITDAGYMDAGNNGELSESRDAAKDASHPADTHESTWRALV